MKTPVMARKSVKRLLALAAKGNRAAARELQRREVCVPYTGSLADVVLVGGATTSETKLVTGDMKGRTK